MSPNKRKIILSDVSDEDEDSFKHRRSSLRVNLSYCTNLSDSGNGSLGKTQVENDERRMDKSLINKKLSSTKCQPNVSNKTLGTISNESKCVKNKDNKSSLQVKEGIQLKRLTITLEDINAKEQALDTNCKRLKDAILSKTKEIFSKQDELSVKTAMVLADQENCSINDTYLNTNKSTNQDFEDKRSITHNQHTDTASNQQKKYEYPDTDVTPKVGEKQRNSGKVINRSKLTPKRLFTEKNKKCRIIEDITSHKPFSSVFLKQVDRSSSPILSGSNNRLQLLKSQSRLFSQNQSKDHNKMHMTICSEHNINIGQPLTCSTFIENSAKDEESQQGDVNVSQCIHTINTPVSMEMTEIHDGIQTRGKHLSLLSRGSCNSNINTKKKKCNNKNVKQNKSAMSAQKLESINSPLNRLALQNSSTFSDIVNNQNVTAVTQYANTKVLSTQSASIEEITFNAEIHDVSQVQEQNNEIKEQSNRQYTLNLSDNNLVRSSLNVNTSLDVITETSRGKSIEKSGDRGITVINQHLEITTSNEESMVLDNQRESINTNRTSLEVNTSIDSVYKTCRTKDNCLNKQTLIENKNKLPIDHSSTGNRNSSAAEDTEANDVDSLENISLIERLRNISARNQASYNDELNKLKIPETGNKERTRDVQSNDVINTKFQNSNNSRDSYVEGTPYPISHSVLFKRQIKHKIQSSNNSATSCNNKLTSVNNEENNSRAKSNDS